MRGVLAWLALVIACGLSSLSQAALPDFAAVKAAWIPSEAWLLDRNGLPLHEMRIDMKVRRADWTPLESISPALIAAVLQAEDQRFFEHSGVDWLAASHAALSNLLGNLQQRRPRGASTLSMQLVGLLDPEHRPEKARRSVPEKWDQMQAARELEKSWSKEDILEAYFNLLPMRRDMVGIDAAARGLFDKRPRGLSAGEAIIIAALIRSPNAKPADVARRTCALARKLPNAPDCKAMTRLTLSSLSGRYPILPSIERAPHVAAQLLRRPGQRLTSSLDLSIQSHVQTVLDDQLRRLAPFNVNHAAALVLDNASGEVLAYVSASAPSAGKTHNDGVRARRQAGSTLKPFLYGLALDRHYLTAASHLPDREIALGRGSDQYAPSNYDHQYRGSASLRYALAGSLNIPAVETLSWLGEELFAAKLRELGFEGLTESADFYGPALALGSLDVNLWELTNAYRALANGGRFAEPRLDPATARGKGSRVFSPEASFVIADILADRLARAPTFGLDSVLATRYWSAVKTGTSKDMRDNWCIGFSDRHTVGIWVGNFDGEPMHDVSGTTGAAPAWRDILDTLQTGQPSKRPKPPRSLLQVDIDAHGSEPTRKEWFLPGTQPAQGNEPPAQPAAQITVPRNGSILAYDPDIPAHAQKVKFTAQPPQPSGQWRIDGEINPEAWWTPTSGRHTLELLDAGGKVIDSSVFEVR